MDGGTNGKRGRMFGKFSGVSGGRIKSVLWKQYPGCVVNWAVYVEHLTLEQGRRYFGMRPVMGGFDNRREGLLYCGDQKQVEEETRRLIRVYKETFGNTDSLILGADCSFLPDFQAERFRWVLETARKTANG